MNNTMHAITSVFTGKGSTIKLAIFGSLITAVIYEIVDANYGVHITTKDGSVALTPPPGLSGNPMLVGEGQENEAAMQHQANTESTDDQAEDESITCQ